jgi:ribosomal protein L33
MLGSGPEQAALICWKCRIENFKNAKSQCGHVELQKYDQTY